MLRRTTAVYNADRTRFVCGTVVKFNFAKCFGFVAGDDGRKYYVSSRSFRGIGLEPGWRVTFEGLEPKSSKMLPTAVRIIRHEGAVCPRAFGTLHINADGTYFVRDSHDRIFQVKTFASQGLVDGGAVEFGIDSVLDAVYVRGTSVKEDVNDQTEV